MSDGYTISKEEFNALKSGDIVLVRGRYLRTIQHGPGDDGSNGVIVSKLNRSQYRQGITVCFWCDVNRSWQKTPMRNAATLNGLEYERLLVQRFDPCKEMKRALFRQRRCDRRKGKKPFHPKIKPIVKP